MAFVRAEQFYMGHAAGRGRRTAVTTDRRQKRRSSEEVYSEGFTSKIIIYTRKSNRTEMAQLITAFFRRETNPAAAAAAAFEKLPPRKLGQDVTKPPVFLNTGKKYSNNKDAIRKRLARGVAKQKKKREGAATPRREPFLVDFEKETHYIDERGRKRKRKKIRSRASEGGNVTKNGRRRWTDSERNLVVDCYEKCHDYGAAARHLVFHNPSLFGHRTPGKPDGITRYDVRQIVLAHKKGVKSDDRGRPPSLPHDLLLVIIAAMGSVVAARTTLVSAPALQPVAIGVIIANGYSYLLEQLSCRAKKVLLLKLVYQTPHESEQVAKRCTMWRYTQASEGLQRKDMDHGFETGILCSCSPNSKRACGQRGSYGDYVYPEEGENLDN